MTRARLVLTMTALGVGLFGMTPAHAQDAPPPAPPSLPDVGGYVVSDVRKEITASFVVPDLVCGAEDEGMLPLVMARGDQESLGGAGVQMSCVDGEKTVRAVFLSLEGELDPVDEVEIRSGDRVSITVSIRRQDFVIEIVNETRGEGVGSGQSDTRGRLGTVVVGDARLPHRAGVLDTPAFGTHEFSDLRVDGAAVRQRQARRSQLLDDEGDVVVRASRLHEHRSAFTARSTT